jgi:hypothetical protein
MCGRNVQISKKHLKLQIVGNSERNLQCKVYERILKLLCTEELKKVFIVLVKFHNIKNKNSRELLEHLYKSISRY